MGGIINIKTGLPFAPSWPRVRSHHASPYITLGESEPYGEAASPQTLGRARGRTNGAWGIALQGGASGPDYGDRSAFGITLTESTGLTFTFSKACYLLSGHSSYVVLWGDGSQTEYASGTPSHTYTGYGDYTIQISNDISFFGVTQNKAVTHAYRWGDDYTGGGYNPTYQSCTNLTGTIPEWSAKMTNLYNMYSYCSKLTGPIPTWPTSATLATSCYEGCTGIVSECPEWTPNITSADSTYRSCRKLTGVVPAWNSKITNAHWTYYQCYGLTGNIPAWNSKITNAHTCYGYCTGLTGVWDGATDATLMPSTITTYTDCVKGAGAGLRANFLTTWGGTRTE